MADHPDKSKWEALAEKELRGKPLDSLTRMTPEGIPIKPLYTAEDLEGIEFNNTLPGFDPFVRGVRGTVLRKRHTTSLEPSAYRGTHKFRRPTSDDIAPCGHGQRKVDASGLRGRRQFVLGRERCCAAWLLD